jgi:hypothetical protein
LIVLMKTRFPPDSQGSGPNGAAKHSQNIPSGLEDESECTVKFPKRLRHRGNGKVLATIYKQPDCYRLYWRERVDGKPKSRMKDFSALRPLPLLGHAFTS